MCPCGEHFFTKTASSIVHILFIPPKLTPGACNKHLDMIYSLQIYSN